MVNNSTRAAIYLRISLDPSGEGLAVERQLSDCKRIATERGWTVIETYSDTVSASKRTVKRENYERMLADYAAGRFDALVCWDLDRLTRQPRQLEDWIELAEERGLVIVTANGEADLSNDNGRMFARIKASVARAEIERKSARQRSKNEQRSSSGQPVPGRRRFGYKSDNMTPLHEEAELVTKAFSDIREGKSLRSIGLELGWRPVRVREMLANPSYKGMVVHRGVALPSNKVTPLVTPEHWEEVQAILGDPARKTSPGNTIKYLASGLVFCGVCGASLHHQNEYICSVSTAHVSIQKKQLDPLIEQEVLKWAMAHKPVGSGDSPRMTELLVQSAELARKRTVVQEMATWEGTDLADTRKQLAALGAQIEKVNADVLTERGAAAQRSLVEVLGDWWNRPFYFMWKQTGNERLSEWPGYWAGLGLDKQRELLRSTLRITVGKGRGLDRVKVERLEG